MSLIDAREPSFVTSVVESSFSVFPESVSVLFERSKFSMRPVSSSALPVLVVPLDAVALLGSVLPLLAEPMLPLLAEPMLPLLPLPLADDPGSVELLPEDADPDGEPIEPWLVSLVLLPGLVELVELELLLP
jgi:hypothetical protein